MTEQKKTKLITAGIGLVMILAAVFTVVLGVSTKHYTATVTEITRTNTTHSKKGRTKHHEWVNVTYKDDSGTDKTASNIHLKSSSESTLPKVGDTLEVKGKIWVTEYSPVSYFVTAFFLLFVGIFVIIKGLTHKDKKPKEAPTADAGESPTQTEEK